MILSNNKIVLVRSLYGVDNNVFIIKNQSNKIGVLKIYNKYSNKEVSEITKVISELQKLNFPVPKISQELFISDKPAVLMEYIEGKHLSIFTNLAIKNVAYLMADLHNSDLKINLHQYRIILEDYFMLFDLCSKFRHIKEIQKIFNKIDMSYLKNLPLSIVHGDFSCSNILFDNHNNISGLLDCDHCCSSYSLTDLARAQLFFSFDHKNNLNEGSLIKFVRYYNNKRALSKIEKDFFYWHMSLTAVKIILETYYYVNVKKEIKLSKKYNQFYFTLLEKLRNIKNKKSLTF